jgi:hypothetical protein
VRRLLVAVAIAFAASPAQAIEFHIKKEGLRLDIIESLTAAYHGDLGSLITESQRMSVDPMAPLLRLPERHFYDIINRLNVNLQWRRFRLATRWDTAVYFDTPPMSCAATSTITLRSRFCQNYFYPEKLTLEYSGRAVEATLGDFYVSFGRGLVLSLRKLDELGIDTTLQGTRFVFHDGPVAATLVAGVTNIQNVDQATGRFAGDPRDVIAGGRAEYRFFDKVNVGAHVVGGIHLRNASNLPQKRSDGMLMYGGNIDAPRLTRWLSLYAEAAGQMVVLSDRRSHGYALYGAATGYFGPVAIVAEVKHYSTFQRWRSSVDGSFPEFVPVAYNQPPTAERILTELVAPTYDVSGARLRADWRVNANLLLYASYAYFSERGVPGGLHYHDPYGGAEIRWDQGRSHLFPSGGFRTERCGETRPENADCHREGIGGEFQQIGHVEWDFTQYLPRRLSVEAQGFALFRRGEGVLNPDNTVASWTEGNAYFAFKWTPYLVFSLGYEWSTRPSPRINQHFFNGSVQYNITTATSIRVFAGGTRGGLRCISGVCRDFPSFTGALLELVVRL